MYVCKTGIQDDHKSCMGRKGGWGVEVRKKEELRERGREEGEGRKK